MDNLLLDTENNAKISDSAYSNSCSNSQSRRSRSSKSTHSGSNSSGSSGYGGKPSTSGSSNTQQPEKRIKDKETKKKKSIAETLLTQIEEECRPPAPVAVFEEPKEEKLDVELAPPTFAQTEKGVELMEIVATETIGIKEEEGYKEGFSCLISMHDGVVMYATSSLTSSLGFPKDMWIGRSFIDFVHPRDRNTFASQITNGLAVPKITQEKAQSPGNSMSTMVCRIRQYRGLNAGFGVKERIVTFLPFLLKLTFKDISDDKGNVMYLVIQATPFFSAFKLPNETIDKAIPFIMRHAADGLIEYIDPASVPYLGYLPHDLTGMNALNLYHPEELGYLGHVYETIVKEGRMSASKPYRMLTQNGDYLRLETEWSSFINPWSRKLEFVTGKHFIIEGPSNPNVFEAPSEPEKATKQTEEEKNKAQGLRDSIIRILNEVLTKPAEVAKQQMSKRCQDLASFMESLMEEQPKPDDEFRLEIQDAENSYYERDSVMLGGISPHHEYNDSKSSTETPLSYNQLNYNDTLQRYFDSHQSFYYDDFHTATNENNFCLNKVDLSSPSLAIRNSGDSREMSSCAGSAPAIANTSTGPTDDCLAHRLTESLITKHNADMEKELIKMHRESRSSKGEREKASNDTKKKKKEHLARCNASFQPTTAGTVSEVEIMQPHGIKRNKQTDGNDKVAHKHHCPEDRGSRRKQTTTAPALPATTTIFTTQAASYWPPQTPMNNMNAFILGVGLPQQMSIMNPLMPQQMAAMPGMFPMYYAPTTAPAPMPSTSTNEAETTNTTGQFQTPAMQCMMYGQAMYGSPFMYMPITHPQVTYPAQQSTMMAHSMQYSNTLNPLGLSSSNYEVACKPSFELRSTWGDEKRANSQTASSKIGQGSGDSNSSTTGLNRSTDALPDTSTSRAGNSKSTRMHTSDETVDRTDGESSYSSFYSSFFKTESGSAEDSAGGADKKSIKFWSKRPEKQTSEEEHSFKNPRNVKKISKRKMEPPWAEQVCVTSELIYKYQILTKNMEDVLTADKQKINTLEQPTLVNEQLGQLYLDLQLEGVASRLTLEEGITSSSSSGEDTCSSHTKTHRRKREHSKLVMIYEEDAPLPPPPEDEPVAGTSTEA